MNNGLHQNLAAILPPKYHSYISELSKAINLLTTRKISETEFNDLFSDNKIGLEIAKELANKQIVSDGILISFGSDSQVGDITIRDIVHGDIYNLQIASNDTLPVHQICAKCKKINAHGQLFCANCGSKLIEDCPECKNTSVIVATGYCISCGYSFEVAKRRVFLRNQIAILETNLSKLEHDFANISEMISTALAKIGDPPQEPEKDIQSIRKEMELYPEYRVASKTITGIVVMHLLFLMLFPLLGSSILTPIWMISGAFSIMFAVLAFYFVWTVYTSTAKRRDEILQYKERYPKVYHYYLSHKQKIEEYVNKLRKEWEQQDEQIKSLKEQLMLFKNELQSTNK